MTRRGVLVGLTMLALGLPAPALALPGDPPITAIAPAEGASVPADADGVDVSFACPAYVEEVYGDPADPTTSRGGSDDYSVRFSNAAAVGADGLLAAKPYGSDAAARDAGDGTCTARLDTYDTAGSPEIVGGRVYWQAYRDCIGCTGRRAETGPVRSFVITAKIAATLTVPDRVYAGYLARFTVRSKAALSGARVLLERRSGSRWKAVTDEAFVTDGTDLYGKLPAGRQTIRAVIRTSANRTTVQTRTLEVRRAGARSTSRADVGAYREAGPPKNSVLSFTVGDAGASLRAFKATVSTFCIGPSQPDNRVLVVIAKLGTVRVAPDGGVVGLLETSKGGREVLTGRLRGGRLTGEISVSLSTCNGTRKFTAVRGGRR